VHLQVLREQEDEVAKLLTIIFEKSWRSGEVPSDWKRGNITAIFKAVKKRSLREQQASQSHLCAWQDHGTDAPGNCAKAHGK